MSIRIFKVFEALTVFPDRFYQYTLKFTICKCVRSVSGVHLHQSYVDTGTLTDCTLTLWCTVCKYTIL